MNECDALRAALEHIATPNRSARATGRDAEAMAAYARNALDTIAREDRFSVSFEGAAFETFQDVIAKMPGYGVTITPQEGEPFEAVLVGPDHDAEMGDTVLSYEVTDGDFKSLEEYQASDAKPRSDRIVDVRVS